MHRYHRQRALRAAQLSGFEVWSALAGVGLVTSELVELLDRPRARGGARPRGGAPRPPRRGGDGDLLGTEPRAARLRRLPLPASRPLEPRHRDDGPSGLVVPLWILAVLAVPPALVVGWISRASVLGKSRAREFSADAAAAAATGGPSAP
jgi:hypothetical protein